MTQEKAEMIKVFEESGIRPTDSYRYCSNDAGGDENVGHTLEDHINFVNRLRMKQIEGGDAQAVIDALYEQSEKDPEFYFRFKLDDQGRLISLFWCDSLMREDFKIYGDVVIFDTTYRTNRYNLICAPIVGVNNHWKNVMFGCAFIADEKIESFVWLLNTFKKAMSGKCPITIFTDQDHAIAKAIETVFPQTRHRLCLWHLSKNAVSHYGLLKTNANFKDAFNKCLSGCNRAEEFQKCWDDMVDEYELQADPNFFKWFARLYDLRDKWCTALSKDFFSAGILSSQRSESTNNALGFRANKSTSLIQFYAIFQETVKRWRKKEIKLEFYCSTTMPQYVFPMADMIKHAAEVYTTALFHDFEEEFRVAIGSLIAKPISEMGGEEIFNVSMLGDSRPGETVSYTNLNDSITVSCSCKNFEETGWLCCHCIRILHSHYVEQIPEKYIVQRWTKMAKKEVWDRLYDGVPNVDGTNMRKLVTIPWRHDMARKYYNLVLKSQEMIDARVVENAYKTALEGVEALLASTSISTQQTEPGPSRTKRAPTVLDPARSITKGRRIRIKSHFNKKKGGRTAKTSKPQEFGSETPNQHLF